MRRAIIIGASSGLGHEVAKILIKDGWQIGIAARRLHLLELLYKIAPDRVEMAAIDVTQSDSEETLMQLIDRVGGCDMFFYASGIGWQNPELNADIELNTDIIGYVDPDITVNIIKDGKLTKVSDNSVIYTWDVEKEEFIFDKYSYFTIFFFKGTYTRFI